MVIARGELVRGEDGQPLRMVGTVQDISDQREAEKALQASNNRFRMMVEHVRDYAIYSLDPEGNIISWNSGAEAIKGYTEEEVIGKNFSLFYPPEKIASKHPQEELRIAASEGRFEEEGWRVRKDGSLFWANVIITSLRSPDGQLIGFTKVVRDISRRKANEELVQRQTGFVRLMQEVVVAANESLGIQQAAQFAIDRVCEHIGWDVGHMYSLVSLTNKDAESLGIWHLSDEQAFKEFKEKSQAHRNWRQGGLIGRVFESGEPVWTQNLPADLNFIRAQSAADDHLKTGMAVPVMVGKQVVGVMEFYSVNDCPPEADLLEVVRNIGTQLGRVFEREQSREALRRSEARFRAIFTGAPLGIELVDMQGRLLEFNPTMARLLGYSVHDLRLAAIGEVDHPANLLAHQDLFTELQKGQRESFKVEKPYLRADGNLSWGRLSVTLVRDGQSEPSFALGILEDITERRQMEAELAELQRRLMEGRELERLHLAQELHDGPMQELYGLSYNLQAFADQIEGIDKHPVKDMQSSLNNVVRTLRAACGELRPPALVPFGLEKAIRSHIENFREAHPEIEVHLNLMPDGQMLPEQVRLALFRIYQQSLNNVSRHANATQVNIRLTIDAEQVIIEIEDNGEGFVMPKRWIEMARQGHMGLVGAFERTQAIGGTMEVESSPGQGTLIRVVAPYQNE